MSIPAQYSWLANIPNRPKMIDVGISLLGIKELPGKATNNPIIMNMAKELGIPASVFPNDETPWCAVAQNYVCLKAGKPLSYTSAKKDVYDLLRARSFSTWGNDQAIAMFGDTIVFKRPGGFHVGLYVAEDMTCYHTMGGNQGNSYSIIRIEKNRAIDIRRFYSIAPPASVRQYMVSPEGKISMNEN